MSGEPDLGAIRERGREARRLGVPFLGNPFHQIGRRPVETGEHPQLWAAKADAWADGWRDAAAEE